MLPTSFLTHLRRFRKEKLYSTLNIIGLSTGLACAIIILLWINDEKSVDSFHVHNDRIYQVIKTAINSDGTVENHQTTPATMASFMKQELPEVERSVSVFVNRENGTVKANGKVFKALPYYASKDFFNVFSYHVVDGAGEHERQDASGVMISEQLAIRLFNTAENVRGKVIEWQDQKELSGPYKIVGVFSTPKNSSAQFDLVFSFEHYYNTFKSKYGLDMWYSNSPFTYLLLRKGTDVTSFNNKIKDYSQKKVLAMHGKDVLQYEGEMFVQRYADKYLYNRYENGKVVGGRIEYVRLFSVVAVIILLLACINFMNLSTAKSASRLKEAGLKKIVGARKSSLVIQFLFESVLMSFVALIVAGLIVYLVLPYFNQLSGKDIRFPVDPISISWFVGIALITGIVSGSYPSLHIARSNPLQVMKSNYNQSARTGLLRKSLVVFQFTLSITFIIAVVTVNRQMQLIREKNLGFKKDNVVYFEVEPDLRMKLKPFLSELKTIPGVINASGMDGNFVGDHSGGGGIEWDGKAPGDAVEFAGFYANHEWVETMGVELMAGRGFSERFAGDSAAVLFNEAAIRAMRLQNPIGKKVKMWGKEAVITGVMKDFHYESLYNRPGPMFVRYAPSNSNVIAKIESGSEKIALSRIRDLYKAYNNGLEFDYRFVDEDFARLYEAENRTAQLSTWFTGLAILISCLGLFGLTAYMAQRRQKEIGIRKVVGAAVHQVVILLSAEFLKLVSLALIVAFPVAWWVMNRWLDNFAYRVEFTADIFIIATIAILLITIITVSIQSVKAALVNPARSLRTL